MKDDLLSFALRLYEEKKFQDSKSIFQQILIKEPNNFNALNLLGLVEFELKNFKIAKRLIEKAIKLKPDSENFLLNLGVINKSMGFFESAILNYKKAININNKFYKAYFNLGNIYFELKKFDLALQNFNTIIEDNKGDFVALNNRGNVYKEIKKFSKAIDDYKKSISINPFFAITYYNLGNVYFDLRKYNEAILLYDKSINLDPNFSLSYNNKANLLLKLGHFKEALENFENSLNLNPNYVESLIGKSHALKKLKFYQESIVCIEKAFLLEPNYKFLFGEMVFLFLKYSIWDKFLKYQKYFENKITTFPNMSKPFATLPFVYDADQNFKISKNYVDNEFDSATQNNNFCNKISLNKKIVLGYFSYDLRDHAVSYLMKGVFLNHNRNDFKIIAFSFKKSSTQFSIELSKIFDLFIDVSELSDDEIIEIARQNKIDIAIDLTNHTEGGRLDIFLKKLAPIQVNYLGYPGTAGSDCYDYIIADKIVIPDTHHNFYSEKIVFLPDVYQANDDQKIISNKVFIKKDFKLPENKFIFCNFSNSYKINPKVANSWIEILKNVSESILWLLEDNPISSSNLIKYFKENGIGTERLIFSTRIPLPEHLKRHSLADLFLDTFPYNGHTTTSDSLWAGLPVLTYLGNSFQGRVSASLLHAINTEELIAKNIDEYILKAIELGKNSDKINSLKLKIKNNILNSNLFKTKKFTMNLENCFKQMIDIYNTGNGPKNIIL